MIELEHLRIVLIETSHPGNIGATARAMKTMGLGRLVLVNPRRFPDPQAQARASGAHDVLARAQVCETLAQALGDAVLVIGTSARVRTIPLPELDPRSGAQRLIAEHPRPVALVFGRERSGLTNPELDHCHYLARIPTNPDYGSLNLAAAVQVFGYELRMAVRQRHAPAQDGQSPEPLAGAQEVEGLYAHLETVLHAIGFLDPANPKHLMRRLSRLFNRARLTHRELQILRGILTAVQKDRRG